MALFKLQVLLKNELINNIRQNFGHIFMHTYFISDLHLKEQSPQITSAFLDFLQNEAVNAERLYILGDLFEFWIGDDAAPLLGVKPILAAMSNLAQQIDCYFIAGNRDFLVGEQFSQQTGFEILSDETIIDLYGTRTLILHGDSLCTDDLAHQQFRQNMVTNMDWREEFLSLEISQRIEQAKQARMQSNQHKFKVSMEIMDVSDSAVLKTFEDNELTQMIHGHTHRQNTHHYSLNGGKAATRYVLGDWSNTSSVLTAKDDGTIDIVNMRI